MAKRRTKKRKPDAVVIGGNANLPRWGTQKQAKANERERGYKNRIHELEQDLASAGRVIENLVKSRDHMMLTLDAVSGARQLTALREVCMIPLRASVDLGLDAQLGVLCAWLSELEDPNGHKALARAAITRAALDKVDTGKPYLGTRPDPSFPSVSGITKTVMDHDDAESIDDLFAKGVDVHLERMDKNYYWLGITPVGGETVHIDIQGKAKNQLRAWVRK